MLISGWIIPLMVAYLKTPGLNEGAIIFFFLLFFEWQEFKILPDGQ